MAESKSASSKLVRDLVALGKKYSKTAFPNPTRQGCPSRSILRAMAYRDRRLTLEDLAVPHVVSCSPCFQEYVHFRRISVLLRGIQITAAFLVVLAGVFVAARFVWNYTSRSGEPSILQKQRAELRPSVATKQPRRAIPSLPIRIDLASFSPTRGNAKDDSGNKVHLPHKLLRVNFLLPLGMEPGEYTLRLQDSRGTVFVDKRAIGRMNDGTTSVEVDIDLSGASPGGFTLMIQPPGLSWRRFPVVIE
jgi:hypothetical protein